jgi:SAM-dependent methyltransferase
MFAQRDRRIIRVALFTSDVAYDSFMGRYSVRLAPLFADFARVEHGMRVLDVGAGTGALTSELVQRGVRAAAADPAPAFVTALRERVPEAEVVEAPAERLPWDDETFDAALAQLVVAFMQDAPAGLAEMRRVTRAGSTVAVCMWDREGMEMLAAINRAQAALRTSDEPPRPYRTREEIESLFAEGYDDVETEALEVESGYVGFEEFWDALRGGAGPAGQWAKSLEGEALESARAELRKQLGEPEGAFRLFGRAWAVRGRKA